MSSVARCLLFCCLCLSAGFAQLPGADGETRASAHEAYKANNYADAFELYRQLLASDAVEAEDLGWALACLNGLNRSQELTELLETVVARHANAPAMLAAAARNYLHIPHFGCRIDGSFQRGHHGEGPNMSAIEHDRSRALQLLQQAVTLAEAAPQADHKAAHAYLWHSYAQAWQALRPAWQLQELTDLQQLPEPELSDHSWHILDERPAPVDREGKPILYHLPENFASAKNDGERWRWCLHQASLLSGNRESELYARGTFAHSQFGVQTLQWLPSPEVDSDHAAAPLAISTLQDDECLAQLASGVQRFRLPAEFHHIALFQAAHAAHHLGEIFLDRQDRPRAAQYFATRPYPERVKAITDDWLLIEPAAVRAAGATAGEIQLRYRNARQLRLQAWRIDIEALLADMQKYLRAKGTDQEHVDWSKLQLEQLGHRLVVEGERKYLQQEVADRQIALTPAPAHRDTLQSLDTGLQEVGAYLVTLSLANERSESVVLWLTDTAIVHKAIDGAPWYFIADSRSGAPLPDMRLDAFGFKAHHDHATRRVETATRQATTDAEGQARLPWHNDDRRYHWLLTARSAEGRLGILGFNSYWYHQGQRQTAPDQIRGYLITDRPVYRPGDTVQIGGWLRRVAYGLDANAGAISGRELTLELIGPRGDEVLKTTLRSDHHGGLELKIPLTTDAALGEYRMRLIGYNAERSFRVEEYKKPEFEVTVTAPTQPVELGQKFTARIQARYLFGAPVSGGQVEYTVTRQPDTDVWLPSRRWDWLYGRGYWWLQPQAPWLPHWQVWGCSWRGPWWPQPQAAPEVVMRNSVAIGADGSVKIEIDTASALARFGDRTQRYQITASVTDASRRQVTGTGSVLAAGKPFIVRTWTQAGWLRAGDHTQLQAAVRGVDGSPVVASGTLQIFRLASDAAGKVTETLVEERPLRTDAAGDLQEVVQFPQAGQFRLALTMRDAAERSALGGAVLSVLPGLASAPVADGYRFTGLELIPDQQEYAAGDTARILIGTAQADAHVLVFLRPENGRYEPPRLLQLRGRTGLLDVPLQASDLPNIFVEALCIRDGEVLSATVQLVLPPVDSSLRIEATPVVQELQPGAEAEIKVRVSDAAGRPLAVPLVATIYDRAVDAIAGGSNLDPIQSFFWNWKRYHSPRHSSNLAMSMHAVRPKGTQQMPLLGACWHSPAGFAWESDGVMSRRFLSVGAGGGAGRIMSGVRQQDSAGLALASMAAAADADSDGAPADGAPAAAEASLRKDFADTAYWSTTLFTDADGTATIRCPMPEDLTTWRVRLWGMGPTTNVGEAETTLVTDKDLLVRLQAPRFFYERDSLLLSANVHNQSQQDLQLTVELSSSEELALQTEGRRQLLLPAGTEIRLDWPVQVVGDGEAVVRLTAQGLELSDGVERRFPVFRYGAPRTETRSLSLRGEHARGAMDFEVPAERQAAESRLVVQVSPSLAASIIEALPYLASYPHGCTEQTLNRFVPTVICMQLLQEQGIDLSRATGAEQLDAGSLPDGGYEDFRLWQHEKPVLEPARVADMVRAGVERLRAMQVADGGWGWFSGYGEQSYPHTTAVVVHGLRRARAAGAQVPEGLITQGEAWLRAHLEGRRDWLLENEDRRPNQIDAYVFTVLAEGASVDPKMQELLFDRRESLQVYAKAMLAYASHLLQDPQRRDAYRRNVEQLLQQNEANQTAWLDLSHSHWWYWYGSQPEAMAWYLKLLTQLEPRGELAARIAKYLLTNRRGGSYWHSTRDTALCVEALAEFAQASGEVGFTGEIDILLDGRVLKTLVVTPENFFDLENSLSLTGEAISTGQHQVEIVRRGEGACYASAWLSIFDQQAQIPAAGLDLQVTRQLYRLEPVLKEVSVSGLRGQVERIATGEHRRVALAADEAVASGQLIEVELTITAANDYEYLLIQDHKAAGSEAVLLRSGYQDDPPYAYAEFRDSRVDLYLRQLRRGTHSLSYRLRAEIPGIFGARPAQAQAMYAPELRGNSTSTRLQIEEAPVLE